MKRALLISGDYEGDETVLTVDLQELEFLTSAVGFFGPKPGSINHRLHLGLLRALRDMRAEARADGADV